MSSEFAVLVVVVLLGLVAAANPMLAMGLLASGYLLFLTGALGIAAWRCPKIALGVIGVIGFIAVMPVPVSVFTIIGVMVARVVWVVRDWLSEPVYAPQRPIRVQAAR